MNGDKIVNELEVLQAPWAKTIELADVEFDGGFKMIRLRIREGKRITDLELDFETAGALSEKLAAWAKLNTPA